MLVCAIRSDVSNSARPHSQIVTCFLVQTEIYKEMTQHLKDDLRRQGKHCDMKNFYPLN